MNKRNYLGLAFVLSCGVWIAQVLAADVASIAWEDLQGKMSFEDPFLTLSEEQIYYLSIYARIDALEKDSAAQVSESMRAEKENAQILLTEQGVDIQYLLDQRERITALRRKAASKTNPDLDGIDIEMGGFMLALDMHEGKVSEFLLVPTVGACIHTPPPPPNQIVLVRSEIPVASKSRFEAIRVRGKLKISQERSSLFLVDGEGSVDSGYIITASEVSKY